MTISEDRAHTEECLQSVAGSMGELLEQLRPHIPPCFINGPAWEELRYRADDMPASMAAFPFGLEIPLHEPAPRADFGVSLVGGSRTAEYCQERGHEQGLVWLLDETDRKTSSLRRIVGRRMVLEYDIGTVKNGVYPAPGIFLYPLEDVLAGGKQQLVELGVIHDALTSAMGWRADAAERRQIERLYELLLPNTRIGSVGVFPTRGRTMRIAMTGFRTADEVVTFLERTGWPGRAAAVGDTASFFAEHNAHLGIHFDVSADGVGPVLGLSLLSREKKQPNDTKYWAAIIDTIGVRGLALPEKLLELARWPTRPTTLYSSSGPMTLALGIHHIKLSITGDQVGPVKGYVFLVMSSA